MNDDFKFGDTVFSLRDRENNSPVKGFYFKVSIKEANNFSNFMFPYLLISKKSLNDKIGTKDCLLECFWIPIKDELFSCKMLLLEKIK